MTDNLGTVRDVTVVGSSTSVTEHVEYDSFGRILNDDPLNFVLLVGYTGQEWDSVVALYQYDARWYDPNTATFLSKDPLGLGPDTNPYRYVLNSSLNAIDPSGKDFISSISGTAGSIPEPVVDLQNTATLNDQINNTGNHGNLPDPFPFDYPFPEPPPLPEPIIFFGFGDLGTPGADVPLGANAPILPPIPPSPEIPPGPDWQWKGPGAPGSPNGNWVGPNGQSLHPDLKHPAPKGPHWGWTDEFGNKWDYFPDTKKWVADPKNKPNRPQPIFPPETLEVVELAVYGYIIYRVV